MRSQSGNSATFVLAAGCVLFCAFFPATAIFSPDLAADIKTRALPNDEAKKIRLNETSVAFAQEMVERGQVTLDQRNAWREHQPWTEEENEFIRVYGFAEYAKWHLGIDESHAENTKARYKFPYGDFKTVHRCALLAARNRARQYGYSDVENAAAQLIEIVAVKRSAQTKEYK
jgi:hypothetical protein